MEKKKDKSNIKSNSNSDDIKTELEFRKYIDSITELIDFVDLPQEEKIDLLEDLENQLVPTSSKDDNKNTAKLFLIDHVKDKDKFLKALNKI